jgi:hypothetical protein
MGSPDTETKTPWKDVTVICALIALVISAVSSYAAWSTIQDQRNSRFRAQAELIFVWQENRDGGRFHIVNRSLEPVPEVDLELQQPNPPFKNESKRSYISPLPPCTEIILDPSKLPDRVSTNPWISYFGFIDSSGSFWKRGRWGKLQSTKVYKASRPVALSGDAIRAMHGKVAKAEGCDGG